MNESQNLANLYSELESLTETLHVLNHEIGEKKVMSDDLTKKLYKLTGAIEFLEQNGVRLPQ